MSPEMHLRWTDYVTDSKCISAICSCIYLGLLYTWATPYQCLLCAGQDPAGDIHFITGLRHQGTLPAEHQGNSSFPSSSSQSLVIENFQFLFSSFLTSSFPFLSTVPFLPTFSYFHWSLSSVGSALLHTFYSPLFPFHFSNHLLCHSCPRI